MKYEPKPINTSSVELSEELSALTESLAKNAHENWAIKRISDGWAYGGHRDDEKKTHPCLVSYEDLPESEKDYDRAVAMETIKVIISLGFKVVKT